MREKAAFLDRNRNEYERSKEAGGERGSGEERDTTLYRIYTETPQQEYHRTSNNIQTKRCSSILVYHILEFLDYIYKYLNATKTTNNNGEIPFTCTDFLG